MRGFSLVELSIVLVILGLLTGGILSGQSLIRAAEIRGMTTQLAQYHASIYTFRDKYMALPGDIKNATAFWGIAGGTGDNLACQDVYSSGTATCNGNGDGYITTKLVNQDEGFRAWQHLANAGLIEGSFTGRSETVHTPATHVIGKNAPPCKVASCRVGISARTSNLPADANYFIIPAGNDFDMRATSGEPFLPEEAWNIDMKLDDGKAMTGMFVVRHKMTGAYGPNCVNSDDQTVADYKIEEKTKRCAPTYRF